MITIREANKDDAKNIYNLVYALAEYEKEPEGVKLIVADYEKFLHMEKQLFNCFIAEDEGKAIGLALWYVVFSTWTGPNMFLEDLFVLPDYRGEGVGRMLLKSILAIADERGYGRVRWDVIDFNEPAKKVYRKLGARHVQNWEHWRLEGDQIKKALENL